MNIVYNGEKDKRAFKDVIGQTVDALMKLQLPSGVEVEIKV